MTQQTHKLPQRAGFATRAIHHGYDPADHEGALTPPLHLSSTFTFPDAQTGAARFAGEAEGHIYSRISNPTTGLLEARMASLEGAEAGLATASGMGAITATFWSLIQPGDTILADATLYGGTHSFFEHGLARFGVKIISVDMSDEQALDAAMQARPNIVYFETPTNPTLRLIDIAAVSAQARKIGALTIVDNTYATPALTRPISLGADIVVHSATKYLGGHGDLVGGIAVGSAELIEQIRLVGMKDMTGAVMAPFNAMLVLRGLKTLELRMERHSENALKVAHYLEGHPHVTEVIYPGLTSFAQGALAARQMARPGGMIAFEVIGGHKGGVHVMNHVQLIALAVSLGDAETLIEHPASMTHSTYSPEERAAHDIREGMIRLSVGLETVDDIIADLERALSGLTRSDKAA